MHHLPDQMDLVTIELDTEDERTFLVCFFHTTRFFLFPSCFCSLSVWRGRLAPTPSITHFVPPYRHPNDVLSQTKQG